MTVLEAMAHMEGFYQPGSRAARNNNPLNMNFVPWEAELFGATLETPIGSETARFAHFPDSITGFNAARHRLGAFIEKGLSVMLNVWAPPVENNVSAYLAGVTEMTGLTADTVLTAELIG
jgi:hypothetical protein